MNRPLPPPALPSLLRISSAVEEARTTPTPTASQPERSPASMGPKRLGKTVPRPRPVAPPSHSSVPAERDPLRRPLKRKRSPRMLDETSSAEIKAGRAGGPSEKELIQQVKDMFANMTPIDSDFIIMGVGRGQVAHLTHIIEEHDAIIRILFDIVLSKTGGGDHGSIEWSGKKRVKREPIELEQHLLDAIKKARTHCVIQLVLDYHPGKGEIPSPCTIREIGSGTDRKRSIQVPDWNFGPNHRANGAWMVRIQTETCKDIDATSSELKDALNNDKMKLSVLNAIELSAITYFESLRRLWKVEKRSEKKEISNKQNRRDARIQRVHKSLTNDSVLDCANIWIARAALELEMPMMKIEAEDVPLDALSDLESDPEDVDEKDLTRSLKEGGIENAPSKWMSRKKFWTTKGFESLKDLLKEIAKTEAADTSNLRKRGFSTPIYNGPVSRREPSSMGHIQAWIVDDRIAMEGATNCGVNRKPPFTEESIKRLPALFSEALRFFRDREAIRRKWNSSVARNEL